LGDSHVLENLIPRYLGYSLGCDIHIEWYVTGHLGESIYYHQYTCHNLAKWLSHYFIFLLFFFSFSFDYYFSFYFLLFLFSY